MEQPIIVLSLEDAHQYITRDAYSIGANHSYFLQNGSLPKGQDGKEKQLELRTLVEITGVTRTFGRIRFQVTDGFISVNREPQNLILIEQS
tara:strand:- start:9870 stop:10142 length:273 start_codon:yes stop_codon:yes gene_type:complete